MKGFEMKSLRQYADVALLVTLVVSLVLFSWISYNGYNDTTLLALSILCVLNGLFLIASPTLGDK